MIIKKINFLLHLILLVLRILYLFSIKKEKQKLILPCFNKTIIKNNKISHSLNNKKNNINNKRNFKVNNSYYQNEDNKSLLRNKSLKNIKSFIIDYFNRTNLNKTKINLD